MEDEPTLGPVMESVHLSVVVTASLLVGLLFLIVYVQLCMVVCYGYKLFSYQTVLLFSILVWAALRLTLYAFYYYHCCDLVKELPTGWNWLLVSFPYVLQVFVLALLVHFFVEHLFRGLERQREMTSLNPPYRKLRYCRCVVLSLWGVALLCLFIGSVAFSWLIGEEGKKKQNALILIRLTVLDGLSLLMSLSLALCISVIYTTRAGKDALEVNGVAKFTSFFISSLMTVLFASRAIYDIVLASRKGHQLWIFTTNMADFEFQSHYGYMAYLVVMLVWEVLPTYLIVLFFRVRIPSQSNFISMRCTKSDTSSYQNKKHFFDNPHRYDSVTEYGSFQKSSQMPIPSLNTKGPAPPLPPCGRATLAPPTSSTVPPAGSASTAPCLGPRPQGSSRGGAPSSATGDNN